MQDSSKINPKPIVDKIEDWGVEEVDKAFTNAFEIIALSAFDPAHDIPKHETLWDIYSLRKSFRESWADVKPQAE